jgi:hypothetical protein
MTPLMGGCGCQGHGEPNRHIQVARCTSTSAENNITKFTAS